MPKHSQSTRTLASCYGRDEIAKSILESALDSGAVLMFGGRQAGKTTLLRKLEADCNRDVCSTDDLRSLTMPVYADLMTLPYDATPRDFFRLLSTLALHGCRRRIQGFELLSLPAEVISTATALDCFISDLQTLFAAAGNVDIHFVFLLDEAKRVLFDRFPRGFQDNLFALLFGHTVVSSRCSLVFAGAQDLYRFCEDDTSPIGSRAEKHLITNLPLEAITDIVSDFSPSLRGGPAQEQADMIFSQTGGHAGLSAYLAVALGSSTTENKRSLQTIVDNFQAKHSELFQIWTARFSHEARLITDRLIVASVLKFDEVTRILHTNGMPSFRADRVFEELQFTGIVVRENDSLVLVNQMYANVARHYIVKQVATESERPVWTLLEELELNLRELVRMRFDQRWPGRIDAQIAACLGEESWNKISENKRRYVVAYHRATKTEEPNTLDFTYLGQLGQLITWKPAWEMFKTMFRDKRDLEDMLREITPVRNDSAHFRSVPKNALDRCRMRCEDLLTIVEKQRAA